MNGKLFTKIIKNEAVTKVVKVVVSNAPKILTGISIVSSIAATAFAVKGTVLAVKIEEQRKEKITSGDIPEPEHPKLAVVKSVWKCYIPSAAFLVLSIGTSLYGTNIASARTAMATAACKVTELAFDEYKAKVVEEIGQEKEKKIRQDIAKENAEQYEIKAKAKAKVVPPFEKHLCQEKYSGIKFYSNLYEIKDTFNRINYDSIHHGEDYISMCDYLDYFDIDSRDENVGWNVGITGLLDLSYEMTSDEYDRPLLIFGPGERPYENYNIYG